MLSSSVSVVDSVHDLGVVIDSRLMMSDHVTVLCQSGYYQLYQLRPEARALPEAATKTLGQAFVSCRLSYCNVLLYGISDNLFQRMQLIRNAAAQLPKLSLIHI